MASTIVRFLRAQARFLGLISGKEEKLAETVKKLERFEERADIIEGLVELANKLKQEFESAKSQIRILNDQNIRLENEKAQYADRNARLAEENKQLKSRATERERGSRE